MNLNQINPTTLYKENFKKIVLKLFFLFFCFLSISLFSQSKIKITGRIVDKTTKLPVSYATIILKKDSYSLGLYANLEGDFSIKNIEKYQSDIIIISSIGYKKKYIPIKELKREELNIIFLDQAKETLNEITVVSKKEKKKRKKRVRPKSLIKEAIKRIPKNYPIKPYTFVSYYRDYLKRNKEYSNLNEAIIQTVDSGFITPHYENKFRLLDYKKNKDFPRETFIPDIYDTIWKTPDYQNPNKFIPYGKIPNQGGNELFILLAHDPVRNYNTNSFAFIYKLSRDFLNNHSFNNPIKIYKDNILLYKVPFYARKTIRDDGNVPNAEGFVPEVKSHYIVDDSGEIQTDEVIIEGEIVINPKDYTIHQIKYKGTLASTNKKIYELVLEYGYTDYTESLMRLNYISFNNEFFTIDHTDENYFKVTTIVSPMRVNNKEILIRTNAIIDKKNATSKYNYDFFQNEKKLEIEEIRIEGKNIRINFSKPTEMDVKLIYWVRNIRDVEGRVINERKVVGFYQYRELFVQQFDKDLPFSNKCYMLNKPLIKNCISKSTETPSFFMNSPLKNDDQL